MPLLGAENTNGIGPLTLRTGGDLELTPADQEHRRDRHPGGRGGSSLSRDLSVEIGADESAWKRMSVSPRASSRSLLSGKAVKITTGEMHSNGGNITSMRVMVAYS